MQNIRILTAGDSSILIEFGKEISPEINRKISATIQLMKEQHIEGVVDMIPAFCSLLINYDPRVISYDEIRERMQALVKVEVKAGETRKRIFEIPVCYGGEYGPDIANIAEHAGLTEEEVIRIHSSKDYLIYMLGFLPGTNGGPRGDLLVEVNIARHPIFQGQDMNIFSSAPITYAQAALGGEVHINTVDGDVVYDVKPGTQTDTRIRLKGKGVPSLRNKNVRGDHYVTLVVQVPTNLNEEAKEALRKFDEACGNRPSETNSEGTEKHEKKKKSFMDKLKETFED